MSNKMNSDYTLFHLEEAMQEIQNTIQEIQNGTASNEPHLHVNFEHLYHHINTAWNSRSATPQEANDCSEKNFEKWRQFPQDLDLSCS
tara:strand:- start:1367 stop:1630 length:264 start_codon:yes stop_codon:yes gene_type:complete